MVFGLPIDKVIALVVIGFALGAIFEIILRLINSRGTIYGILDVESAEDGFMGAMRLDEKQAREIMHKRRLVLKVRTKNKDFNGNE